MAKHIETGKEGEIAAVNFLRSKGFEIVATNFRYQKAEIDIIAFCNNTLVFVEVKTRSNISYGFPEEFVNKKKQQLMAQTAAFYLEEHNLSCEVRFDVISIHKTPTGLVLHHFQDAFFPIDG